MKTSGNCLTCMQEPQHTQGTRVFSGVHVHAGHGFLLSQFLSPLFNRRDDGYGGSIEARCRIVLDVIGEVRRAVGPSFPVGVRINSTDNLEGGLTADDALGGGSPSRSNLGRPDRHQWRDLPSPERRQAPRGSSDDEPYFLGFARRARRVTDVPLMLTGGFTRREQAVDAVAGGAVDIVRSGACHGPRPQARGDLVDRRRWRSRASEIRIPTSGWGYGVVHDANSGLGRGQGEPRSCWTLSPPCVSTKNVMRNVASRGERNFRIC